MEDIIFVNLPVWRAPKSQSRQQWFLIVSHVSSKKAEVKNFVDAIVRTLTMEQAYIRNIEQIRDEEYPLLRSIQQAFMH
jgi:hypothetical protein